MDDLEIKGLRTSKNPRRLWKRYVDGTFITQDIKHKDKFLQHIKSMDKANNLTVEDTGHYNKMNIRRNTFPEKM